MTEDEVWWPTCKYTFNNVSVKYLTLLICELHNNQC